MVDPRDPPGTAPDRPRGAAAVVALCGAACCLALTARSVLAIRGNYTLDCQTGYMSALGELFCAPLPLALPLGVLWASTRGTAVWALARRCLLWPGLLWLLTFAMGGFGPALFRP